MNKKMERLALAGRLEVKLAEPGVETTEKTFSGYGAVFGNQDHASDIIAPGAFTKTLADHKANGSVPAMFFNHDAYSMPIGIWTALEEDDYGLKADGVFLDTAAGRDAYTAVKAGAVTGLSIGFWVTDFSMEGGVRTIHEAKLMEISVVTFPCNERARVSDVKSDQPDDELTEDDFMAKLAELGIEEEDAKALAAKRFKSDEEAPVGETDEKSNEAPTDEEKLEDGEDEEADEASDDSHDSEAKYMETAIEAVNNLIRELKQENHGR